MGMGSRACRVSRERVRPLTKHEIDRRIDQMLSEFAESGDDSEREDGEALRPRWIAASELVRRMRPHIVLN